MQEVGVASVKLDRSPASDESKTYADFHLSHRDIPLRRCAHKIEFPQG